MVAEELCTNHAAQAVGTDQNVTARRFTVRESCRHSRRVLDKSCALMIEVQVLRIHLAGEHG
jgi:hypothetical protein